MKKSLILVSVLALAACHGGSGGGGGAADVYNQLEVIGAGTTGNVSLEAAESNSNVTSMVSEIGVADDGTTINIVNPGRGAITRFMYNGKEYTSYRLDDVRFETGPVNGELSEDMYVTFGIDEATGEINSVVYHEGGESFALERQGDTNVFVENVYKYRLGGYTSDSYDTKPTDREQVRADIEDMLAADPSTCQYYLDMFDALGDDWNADEHWIQETHNTAYNLKGKELDTKLRYSDFGYNTTTTVGYEDSPDYTVIAGGYEIKKIDLSRPEFADKTFNFSGTAIGSKAHGGESYVSEQISTDNGAATLVFENGHETLTMPFNDYYTVTVNKNGDNANIAFTDYKGSDNDFKFVKETDITTGSTDKAFVSIKYFGDDNNPTETVGTVHYEEYGGTYPGFSGAFGMTRQ